MKTQKKVKIEKKESYSEVERGWKEGKRKSTIEKKEARWERLIPREQINGLQKKKKRENETWKL